MQHKLQIGAGLFLNNRVVWELFEMSAPLRTASLRRSFRLKKDRQGSETQTPDANQSEFLIYEEVAQYLPRAGERPRLIVLIGRYAHAE